MDYMLLRLFEKRSSYLAFGIETLGRKASIFLLQLSCFLVTNLWIQNFCWPASCQIWNNRRNARPSLDSSMGLTRRTRCESDAQLAQRTLMVASHRIVNAMLSADPCLHLMKYLAWFLWWKYSRQCHSSKANHNAHVSSHARPHSPPPDD